MTFLTAFQGLAILFSFGALMTFLALTLRRAHPSPTQFLLADRQLGPITGAFSIAASWIWAPALFISVQVTYQMGLAGLFWFTVPNMAALMLFALLAPRIRRALPDGVTLPQYIRARFQSERLHTLFLVPTVFYQLMAVAVQLFAGGSLVALLTGLSLQVVMPILLGIALFYTGISGLKASVWTDVIQLSLIFGIGAVILPLVWRAAGGWGTISQGLTGIQQVESMWDPQVAFSFGIVTAIGLIAGALSDQQYWQRSFALKEGAVVPAFLLGGLLFGLVPLGLSLLGLVAVANGYTVPAGTDVSMIGVQTVVTLLPDWAILLFFVMLLSGLSSTLDSGLSAMSSLWATDIQPKKGVRGARWAMLGIGLAGWAVATAVQFVPGFGLQHLWWVFNTIAACVAGPLILSLGTKRVRESGTFWGILLAFFGGIPLFIWANLQGNTPWIVGAAMVVVGVSSALSYSSLHFFKNTYN